VGKFSLFLLLVPGIAVAQAPGEIAPAPAGHWSVAASLALGNSLPERAGPTADKAIGLGVLELDGRYRVLPSLELGLGLALGVNNADSFGGLFFEPRMRLVPERTWNAFVLADLGIATLAPKNASSDKTKGRVAFRAGAALERRWDHWALETCFRLLAMAANHYPINGDIVDFPPEEYAQIGVSISVGGSYRF